MKARTAVAPSIAAALLVGLVAVVPPAQVLASHGEPDLRLISTTGEATAVRYGRRAARLQPALYVGATAGTLDLRVRRGSFAQPLTLTQRTHPGSTDERELSTDLLDGWRGLDDFFRIRVTDADGAVVWTELVTFCPNSYMRQRLGDDGPDVPTFPYGCYRSPRLLGMAWGIDQSWAVSASAPRGFKLPVPDGAYTVEVAITPSYQELFRIAPDDASVRLPVTVTTVENERCPKCRYHESFQSNTNPRPHSGVPDMTDPDASVLPDLGALPSFDIGVRNRRNGRSFLEFGATVWVSGAAPVVVEGFRRSDEPTMDAYQYFYDDGEPVGRAPAGSFEYDRRDGHHHWHILQFVRYRLLDADRAEPLASTKESFCLVPTDAVDLSLDNAARAEEGADLHTSCGGEDALWIRETLPVGWGDTYHQGGRYGFEITNLPNGTYFVEIAANPDGLLHEQDDTNNVSLREVMLRGKPGARRVVVPDPYGIDSPRGGHVEGHATKAGPR